MTGAPRPRDQAELIRALAVLCEPPDTHERLWALLGLPPAPDAAAFSELFVLQLPPYASVHLGPEGMLGGVARSRIAGFWRAVGREVPAEPDHLAALLGLYAALVDDVGAADGPEGALAERGHQALLLEHLAPWVFGYLDRVREIGAAPYRSWAELLTRVLAAAVERAEPLVEAPLHLREVPELPDPRTDGGEAFLRGLLAPVRSGVVVTRGTLGRLARGLGLAVRVGERRYVLEHLLGQEPAEVLAGLSAEARHQAYEHASRTALLGDSAVFWERRARRTETLLAELAGGGEPATVSAAGGEAR